MVSPFLIFCEMSVVPGAVFLFIFCFYLLFLCFHFFPQCWGWTSLPVLFHILKRDVYSGDRRRRSLRTVMAA